MPPQKEKQKKLSTGPTPGLLQRIFGSGQMSPEMEEGITIARGENPSIGNVQPYGLVSRILQPKAQGYTSPGRSIYLNPNKLQGQTPQDIADTVLHEQEHVNQMNQRNLNPVREFMHEAFGEDSNLPYYQRPDEINAFAFEKKRRARMNRSQTAAPNFETGVDEVSRGNIHLHTPRVNTGPSSAALREIAIRNKRR